MYYLGYSGCSLYFYKSERFCLIAAVIIAEYKRSDLSFINVVKVSVARSICLKHESRICMSNFYCKITQ